MAPGHLLDGHASPVGKMIEWLWSGVRPFNWYRNCGTPKMNNGSRDPLLGLIWLIRTVDYFNEWFGLFLWNAKVGSESRYTFSVPHNFSFSYDQVAGEKTLLNHSPPSPRIIEVHFFSFEWLHCAWEGADDKHQTGHAITSGDFAEPIQPWRLISPSVSTINGSEFFFLNSRKE